MVFDPDERVSPFSQPDIGVTIQADIAPSFTYASYQNAIPVIRSINISNPSDAASSSARLN